MVLQAVPAKGTRPRNRQAITVTAAAELFHRRGFPSVSMADIAAATNVGASAIYRHFPGKSDLLVAAIHTGLVPYIESLRPLAPDEGIDAVFRRLAECALDSRAVGVLWQRDARYLSAEEARPLRDDLFTISSLISGHLVTSRPELDQQQVNTLAWCIMGAMVSISFHSIELPREQFIDLLARMCAEIAAARFPTVAERVPDAVVPLPADAAPDSRREALITEATELFAERGFAAAGIDEIADAAGIAGPAVYRHFPSKQFILVAVVERSMAALHALTRPVLDADLPPELKLRRLVAAYVKRMNRSRFAMRILISEMGELPDDKRAEFRRVQRQNVDDLVELLCDITGWDAGSARIRVQAILLVVNDAVQTPHLRTQPGFEPTIESIAQAILGIDATL